MQVIFKASKVTASNLLSHINKEITAGYNTCIDTFSNAAIHQQQHEVIAETTAVTVLQRIK